MRSGRAVLCGWLPAVLLVTGCAHHYMYSGTLEAPDSLGHTRQHLLYWNTTVRPLWFDSREGSVRILEQCSLSTIDYDEQPAGIVFRQRERDEPVLEQARETHLCGRILNGDRIIDLRPGLIDVTVACRDRPRDRFDTPQPYLEAREAPYQFQVARHEVKDFNEIPKRPACGN
ncbi:MAG TPA: hypothetical protein VML36_07960 [Nitrospiria bacterium]|nr:hypothetical protein [Nitrospiria bacterium]